MASNLTDHVWTIKELIERAAKVWDDRLFGQIARHLQHQCKVIVLVLETTRKDKYDNFTALVDRYLNVKRNSVEVVGR